MKFRPLLLGSLVSAGLALAQPAPPRPPEPPRPPPTPGMPHGGHHPGGGGPGMHFGGPPGIPPHVAQKVGISPETQKKVKDLSYEANGQLIQLEADLKRAQLELDRALSEPNVDEAAVMKQLDAVSKAELAVRKNRMGLMVRIRKTIGAEAWEKLQAEMGPPPGPPRGGEGPRGDRPPLGF